MPSRAEVDRPFIGATDGGLSTIAQIWKAATASQVDRSAIGVQFPSDWLMDQQHPAPSLLAERCPSALSILRPRPQTVHSARPTAVHHEQTFICSSPKVPVLRLEMLIFEIYGPNRS